uniref:Ig-like domain-containing protein n=1 Tax=Lates calcarifer TaxID=8187 RepID=A0A4W6D8Z6_LATCA
MMNFTMRTALLLGWISVSVSESQTVKVQSGQEVTLLCPKIFKDETVTFWFRLVNRTEVSCISVMLTSNSPVHFCDGYQTGNFEMSSNISTLFLNINQVNVSDSGQYFCFNVMIFVLEKPDVKLTLATVILGGLTLVFMMVTTVCDSKCSDLQNLGSDDLNSAALRLLPKTLRNRRPAETQVETHVIYTASR